MKLIESVPHEMYKNMMENVLKKRTFLWAVGHISDIVFQTYLSTLIYDISQYNYTFSFISVKIIKKQSIIPYRWTPCRYLFDGSEA